MEKGCWGHDLGSVERTRAEMGRKGLVGISETSGRGGRRGRGRGGKGRGGKDRGGRGRGRGRRGKGERGTGGRGRRGRGGGRTGRGAKGRRGTGRGGRGRGERGTGGRGRGGRGRAGGEEGLTLHVEHPDFVGVVDRDGEDDLVAPGQALGPLDPQHHLSHVQQIWGHTKQTGRGLPCPLLGFGSPSQETCSSLGNLENQPEFCWQSLCLVGCDPNALFAFSSPCPSLAWPLLDLRTPTGPAPRGLGFPGTGECIPGRRPRASPRAPLTCAEPTPCQPWNLSCSPGLPPCPACLQLVSTALIP